MALKQHIYILADNIKIIKLLFVSQAKAFQSQDYNLQISHVGQEFWD